MDSEAVALADLHLGWPREWPLAAPLPMVATRAEGMAVDTVADLDSRSCCPSFLVAAAR